MHGELTQEQLEVYATNATAIDKPQGTNYTQGVKVGRTIPAKWWNWLFNALTRCLNSVYTDSLRVFTEVKNTITLAGLTPSSSDNTQMAQAAQILSERAVASYVDNKKRQLFYNWSSSECTGIPWANLISIDSISHIRGAENKGFITRVTYTRSGTTKQSYYVSADMLTWQIVRDVYDSLYADCVYFNGKYYFIYGLSGIKHTNLYVTEDLSVPFSYVKWFPEFGSAVGLRIVDNVLWLISASNTEDAGVSYNSYYTVDGVTWVNAGPIFKNDSSVEDVVGEVLAFNDGFVLGNMYSLNGYTWQKLVAEKPNVANSKLFISNEPRLIVQFSAGEWYRKVTLNGTAERRVQAIDIKGQFSDGILYGVDTETGYLATGWNAYTFDVKTLLFPTNADAEFFKIDNIYFVGNYKTTYAGNLNYWSEVTLPEGATVLQYSGVGCCIIAGNYFSGDKGSTWNEGACLGEPFCVKPQAVLPDLTCMAVISTGNRLARRVTFNGINRVVGTTLYLK